MWIFDAEVFFQFCLIFSRARVVAFDADAGRNADIDYVLDHSQKFTISPKSGIISTSKAFKPGQTKNLKVNSLMYHDIFCD